MFHIDNQYIKIRNIPNDQAYDSQARHNFRPAAMAVYGFNIVTFIDRIVS